MKHRVFNLLIGIMLIFGLIACDNDDDRSPQWQTIGLEGKIIDKLHATRTGTMFAVTENTLYRSIDQGQNWAWRNQYPQASIITSAPDGSIYLARTNGSIVKSTDEGETWSILPSPITFSGGVHDGKMPVAHIQQDSASIDVMPNLVGIVGLPNSTVSTTFLVRNTGRVDVAEVTFTAVAQGHLYDFNPQFDDVRDLLAGQSREVTVTVTVPFPLVWEESYFYGVTARAGSATTTFDLRISVSDVDSDNDGLSDLEEMTLAAEGDFPCLDPYDPDSDDDYLSDGFEVQNGYNPCFGWWGPYLIVLCDGTVIPYDEQYIGAEDADQDGLSLIEELQIYSTNPFRGDTDSDGWCDNEEIAFMSNPLEDVDSDHDGLLDSEEKIGCENPFGGRFAQTNPGDPDTDHDGVTDGEECAWVTNPNEHDILTEIGALHVTADGTIYVSYSITSYYGESRFYLCFTRDNGNQWHYQEVTAAITAIVSAPEGTIWVGTADAGVFRVDESHNLTAINSGLQSVSVNDLAILADGDLVVATENGVYQCSQTDQRWAWLGVNHADVKIKQIVVGADDHLAIRTERGIYEKMSGSSSWIQRTEAFKENLPTAVTLNAQNRLIVGTQNGLMTINYR